MELHKLRYFYAAAQLQHITKAAQELNIAQPAITQAIKSLEEELGVPLFERRGRNIILTEFGLHLKRRLDSLLPELDKLPKELEQLKHQSDKTIRLNILAATTTVIQSIVEYRGLHPDVVFDLEHNSRQAGCDLMIATDGVLEDTKQKAVKRCIRTETISLAVPRESRYANLQSIALSEVREEGFILLSTSRLFGTICHRFCAEAGFEPHILFESDSPGAVKNIISSGMGVAFWPEYSWGKLEQSRVKVIPISNPVCRRKLIIELYDRLPQSMYAQDFYQFLLTRLSS